MWIATHRINIAMPNNKYRPVQTESYLMFPCERAYAAAAKAGPGPISPHMSILLFLFMHMLGSSIVTDSPPTTDAVEEST